MSFDWRTSLVTAFVVPLLYLFLGLLQKAISTWGIYLLDGALYGLGRAINNSIAARVSLRRYCRLSLTEETRYMFVPSSLDIKLEIDQAFVPLVLERKGFSDRAYDHTTLLALSNRIRVSGDPGSGKSSLTKRMMRDTCGEALGRVNQRTRLPILVELRKLRRPSQKERNDLGMWLFNNLRSAACLKQVYKMRECFDTYAAGDGLLVLLDGLDEVAREDYPIIQGAINGLSRVLAQHGERNVIVLTMRTQFHQQIKESYRDCFGPALSLRPFTLTDIYEFLSRWPFCRDAKQQVARIFKELTDRASLREMCANPLVLAMYVAEDQARGHAAAPDSRTDFYQRVTEELLIRRRLVQTGTTPASAKLREQRERILGRLAYDHLLNSNEPANLLSWSASIDVTREIMQCDELEATRIFREISKETGLVTEERSGQTLRFIHLTFCEFLAAFEAIQGQKDGWRVLLESHRTARASTEPQSRARLAEVIPFACGLMQRIDRTAALTDLAEFEDHGLLARTFLETKLYDNPLWPNLIETWKARLLNVPESEWDSEWLRDLHFFNVVVSDANHCTRHMGGAGQEIDLDSFVQTLLGRRKWDLSSVLEAYAAQDAVAVLRLAEISHIDLVGNAPEVIINNLDQPTFFELILTEALEDRERTGAWAGILAEGALRSSVVAGKLEQMRAAPGWQELVDNVEPRDRWMQMGFLPSNMLTQCLTIALDPRARRSYIELSYLGNLPPPGRFRWIYAKCGTLMVALLSLVCWLPAAALLVGSKAIVLCDFGLALAIILLVRKIIRVRRAFHHALRSHGMTTVDFDGCDTNLKALGKIKGRICDPARYPKTKAAYIQPRSS